MNCPRCGAPRGVIGWLCGHTGEEEHDQQEDKFWEDWQRRMERNDNLKNKLKEEE